MDNILSHVSVLSLASKMSIAFLFAWAVRAYLRRRFGSDMRDVPGPKGGSWIWGHELEAYENQAGRSYTQWFSEFGHMVKIRAALGHSDILVAADNIAVQHIFQESNIFVKSPVFRPLIERIIGRGVAWVEGDEHKRMRKILASSFSAETTRDMASDIYEATAKLQTDLTNFVVSGGGSTITNIAPWTSSVTLDIIGRVAFAHDFTQGDQIKQIGNAWNEQCDQFKTKIAFIGPIVIRAFPFITSLPIGVIQAQGKIKMTVKKIGQDILRARETTLGVESEKKRDILSLLLRANAMDVMSEDQLLDNIVTFINTGNETTAGELIWALRELARHPEKQQKLREEVSQIRGSEEPSYDDYSSKFPYLDAVVRETLRIYPSSPYTERIAVKDTVIPLSVPIITPSGTTLSSIRVSAGQIILLPFVSMQTLKSVWGPDADRFVPERWITPNGLPPSNTLPRGWGNLNTFCDGPRNCIGYRLAIFEMKVILSMLIRHFVFEDTGAEVLEMALPTIQPIVEGVKMSGGNLPLKISLVQT